MIKIFQLNGSIGAFKYFSRKSATLQRNRFDQIEVSSGAESESVDRNLQFFVCLCSQTFYFRSGSDPGRRFSVCQKDDDRFRVFGSSHFCNLDFGHELESIHHRVVDVRSSEGLQLDDVSQSFISQLLRSFVSQRMRRLAQTFRFGDPMSDVIAEGQNIEVILFGQVIQNGDHRILGLLQLFSPHRSTDVKNEDDVLGQGRE